MLTCIASSPKVFAIQFVDLEGDAIVPVSPTYRLLEADGTEVISETALTVTSPDTFAEITVLAADHTIPTGESRVYRDLVVSYQDADSNDYQISTPYLALASDLLIRGVNSFASFGEIVNVMFEMPQLKMVNAAPVTTLKQAIMSAYANIGQLNIDLGVDYPLVQTTNDLTETDLLGLDALPFKKLVRASLIEADYILGGSPVEERRKAGLMSHSAAESAHFLRPTKPVDLPVSRETAKALSPYVRYMMRAL